MARWQWQWQWQWQCNSGSGEWGSAVAINQILTPSALCCGVGVCCVVHQLYTILDEMYLGGEVLDTNKKCVLERIQYLEKQE